MTENKVKIATYGSLRKGEYNYESFVRHYGEDNFVYISTHSIPGFKLYSMGAYPAAVSASAGEIVNDLVVDLFEVSIPVYESIRAMELGANYKEVLVNINGEDVILYEYNNDLPESRRVPEGDWSKYLSQNSYV